MVDDIVRDLQARSASFRGLNAPFRFLLENGEVIRVDARSHPVGVAREDGEVDCTIRISAENLAKLMDGRLNPMLAYTMGKLKVDGSMGIAMKLAQLLDE